MASAFDTNFLETAVPALQGWHGVSVTRWPKGQQGASVVVAGCLWTPDEMPSHHADMDGERFVVGGTLQIPASAGPDKMDVWVIDGEQYSTLMLGDVHGHLHTATLRRVDKVTTSRHRGDFL